ncbi:hypothetical protein PY650_16275 [Rhizobium calliandrae]|uniref:Uncharacterized protein n=1 Tax=Rhizobium calliandrae TaxID=1312182 RepID=A0ABT7KGQ3_9HYPH|nr:hypothetical protein [Rhizobium calliandrae]MDL2407195.1 hypothetical protein [Rhizobium calliandrae]
MGTASSQSQDDWEDSDYRRLSECVREFMKANMNADREGKVVEALSALGHIIASGRATTNLPLVKHPVDICLKAAALRSMVRRPTGLKLSSGDLVKVGGFDRFGAMTDVAAKNGPAQGRA